VHLHFHVADDLHQQRPDQPRPDQPRPDQPRPEGEKGPPGIGSNFYRADVYNRPDAEFVRYRQRTRINWVGALSFVTYLAALVFYIWVRITKTLDLGPYLWYGCVILAVELLGATTVLLYGVNLVRDPVTEPLTVDPADPARTVTRCPYHIRVLVPCYKESLEILRRCGVLLASLVPMRNVFEAAPRTALYDCRCASAGLHPNNPLAAALALLRHLHHALQHMCQCPTLALREACRELVLASLVIF
jgi:hypothetical protein